MSVERIEAAIAKLEELRQFSTFGAWAGWRQYNPLRGTLYGVEDETGEEIARVGTKPDAELIEVLHRTIDAQLAILRDEFELSYYWRFPPTDPRYIPPGGSVIALANAILGGDTRD